VERYLHNSGWGNLGEVKVLCLLFFQSFQEKGFSILFHIIPASAADCVRERFSFGKLIKEPKKK